MNAHCANVRIGWKLTTPFKCCWNRFRFYPRIKHTRASSHTRRQTARHTVYLSSTSLRFFCSCFVYISSTDLRRRLSAPNFTSLVDSSPTLGWSAAQLSLPAYTMCGRALRAASQASAAGWTLPLGPDRNQPARSSMCAGGVGERLLWCVCVRVCRAVPCSQSGGGVMVAVQSRDHNPLSPLSPSAPLSPSPLDWSLPPAAGVLCSTLTAARRFELRKR